MRVLFIFEKYLPTTDANISCIDNLCRYLITKNVDVSVLTIKNTPELKSEEVINGYRVYRVEKDAYLREFIAKSRRKFLGHYHITFEPLVKKLVELSNRDEIDVFVPVINPFSTVASVLKAYEHTNRKMKFVAHLLDPITSNESHKYSDKMIERELEMYKQAKQTFVTDLIYAENEHNSFKEYLNKMTVLPFPNFRKLETIPTNDEILYDKSKINCVFVGFLYSKIRDSQFMLEIFNRCQNKDIVFHIVGGSHGKDDNLEKYQGLLGGRLIIHGLRSPQSAINAMMNANILINIGNSVMNQVPSKIFDYISSGKPIINSVKNSHCPTLKYLKEYPYVLNMNEQDEFSGKLIEEFETFCHDNKNKKTEFEDLIDSYEMYMLENVGDKFINTIIESSEE